MMHALATTDNNNEEDYEAIVGNGCYSEVYEGDYLDESLEDAVDGNDAITHVERITTELSADVDDNDDDDSDNDDESMLLTRPILVGYAFGPKKMSTMGVVMAEASKTHLATTAPVFEVEHEDDGDDDDYNNNDEVGKTYNCNNISDEHEKHDENGESQKVIINPPVLQLKADSMDDDVESYGNNVTMHDEMQRASSNSNHDTQNDNNCPTNSSTILSNNNSNNRNNNSNNINNNNNNKTFNNSNNNKKIVIHGMGGLKNVVRYLHSSCSSAGSVTSTDATILTAGTTAMNTITSSMAHTAHSSSIQTSCNRKIYPIRVSFVPLDPNLPLEEQHGGKMDVVLHKLTEDILCLSQMNINHQSGSVSNKQDIQLQQQQQQQEQKQEDREGTVESTTPTIQTTNSTVANNMTTTAQTQYDAAKLRVNRLIQYQQLNPNCALVDHPLNVISLMSRSAIAQILSKCLVGVTSASGIPVCAPKFLVITPNDENDKNDDNIENDDNCDNRNQEPQQNEEKRNGLSWEYDDIPRQLEKENMNYPLIVKPLIAAGTKSSHYMKVLLHPSALLKVQKTSCLLQEYANHDGVLYKVYVLGEHVWVYQRPSLPNLPRTILKQEEEDNHHRSTEPKLVSYLEFNSQNPYPRLSDFGVVMNNAGMRCSNSSIKDTNNSGDDEDQNSRTNNNSENYKAISFNKDVPELTAEEVQPIVEKLKEAFGLELFGFDIIIAEEETKATTATTNTTVDESNVHDKDSTKTTKKKMLVVDVNYFPSYKEVANFPSLLAQYLTQRALSSLASSPSSSILEAESAKSYLTRMVKKDEQSLPTMHGSI